VRRVEIRFINGDQLGRKNPGEKKGRGKRPRGGGARVRSIPKGEGAEKKGGREWVHKGTTRLIVRTQEVKNHISPP